MKKMRKVISVLLAVIMVIGVLPAHSYGVETESHEKIFSDMPYNWSTAALENAVKNGLLTGADGKIMPKDSLTRAQMATIIVRAFGAADKGNLKGYRILDLQIGTQRAWQKLMEWRLLKVLMDS